MRIADVFDILIIAALLYFGILWLKQRASRPLILIIALIALCYVCAQRFGMYMTSSLFQVGFTAFLLTMVIVFQADIRRAFQRFASWSASGGTKQLLASTQTIATIVETVQKLAENSVGALLVIKGRESVDRHLRGGVSLNGRISFPLLYGIFNTHSPTHDGAVIIEGERIDRFAVYLPLSQNVEEGAEAGTRHAAGRGLSEAGDALVIIVSEERGTITIAQHGDLKVIGSPVQLKERLDSFYHSISPIKSARPHISWMRHNLGFKALSMLLAMGLWIFFAHRVETIHRTFTIPIEWRNLPANYFVDSIKPLEAKVSLSGSERDFSFDPSSMIVSLDLGAVHDGIQDIAITDWNLTNKPAQVAINRIEPQAIRLKAYVMTAIDMPIKVRTENSLPGGLRLVTIVAEPAKVQILVPKNRKGEYGQIMTEPLDLSEISQSASKWLKLVLPNKAQLPEGALTLVKVKIDVAHTNKTVRQSGSR
jgi:diadenylate cyclase